MKQIKLVILLVVFLISIIYLEVVKVQIVFLNYWNCCYYSFFMTQGSKTFLNFLLGTSPKKKNDLCIPKVMIKLDA